MVRHQTPGNEDKASSALRVIKHIPEFGGVFKQDGLPIECNTGDEVDPSRLVIASEI